MSINRWMDKEDVVHIHSGMLFRHKKECIWVSFDEVDEPRTYYTEWSESEREILYSNTYIRNLEKWYWRTYLQGCDGARAQPRGATPRPRAGAVTKRSYPVPKVRGSGCTLLEQREVIPHVQGKRNPSKMVGTDRAHQRADRLKHNHRQLANLITQTTALSN